MKKALEEDAKNEKALEEVRNEKALEEMRNEKTKNEKPLEDAKNEKPLEDAKNEKTKNEKTLEDAKNEKPLKKRQRVLTFQSNTVIPSKHANSNSFYQVFVHNLPAGIATEELANAFRNCGRVSKVEILDYSRPEDAEKKRVPRIRQQVSESRIYGFIHFTDVEAREKALIPAMRVFGVRIRDCLCRTGERSDGR